MCVCVCVCVCVILFSPFFSSIVLPPSKEEQVSSGDVRRCELRREKEDEAVPAETVGGRGGGCRELNASVSMMAL